MRLKEALHKQNLKKVKPSKGVCKTLRYLKKNYPDYNFKNYIIVETISTSDVLPQYFIADLYDKKTNTIINIDEIQAGGVIHKLLNHNYNYLELSGKRSKKERIKKKLVGRKKKNFSTKDQTELINSGGFQNDRHPFVVSKEPFISEEDHHFRSSDISDIIEVGPSWILNSGISLVAFVVSLLLLLGFLIKFPDRISGEGFMTSVQPPIAIDAQNPGVIQHISVKNGSLVKEGEELIYIKNSAIREDILVFTDFVKSYQKSNNIDFIINRKSPKNLQLGDLQSLYAQFNLIYNQYYQVLSTSYINSQIKTLRSEIDKTANLIRLQDKEKTLFKEELELRTKNRKRQEGLNENELVSDVDYEGSLITETQLLRQGESINQKLIKNEIKLDQLNLQIHQLQESRNNDINDHKFRLERIINDFWEAHASWEQTYIIASEHGGTISYSNYLSEGVAIEPNETLGFISNKEGLENVVTVLVSSSGIGELRNGTEAIIKIDAYPYKEHGIILGRLSSISDVPLSGQNNNEFYEATILLSSKLYTDHGEEIILTPKMKVTVDFITEDKSIISRLLGPLGDLIYSSSR